MNGTVVLGTVIILVAAFLQASFLIAWLGLGVALIAFGAFGPSRKPALRSRTDEDRFV